MRFLSFWFIIVYYIIFIRDFLLLRVGFENGILRIIFVISWQINQAVVFFWLLRNPRVAIIVLACLFFYYGSMGVAV